MMLVQEVRQFNDGPGLQSRSLGVLPFCVAPGGEVLVLLGREACPASRRWAPFEGTAKPGETCEDGAAREWVEESLGIVPFAHEPGPGAFVQTEAAGDALRRGAYSHRVQLRYHARMRSNAWKEATTLVARVPHDPGIETRFAVLRQRLMQLARFGAAVQHLHAGVDGPRALYGRALRVDGRMLRVVDVLSMHGFTQPEPGWVALEASVRCADPLEPRVRRFACIRVRLPAPTCRRTVACFLQRAVLRALVRRSGRDLVSHPAVHLLRDVHGEVTGARVNPDFLEKDRVRYWTRRELVAMLAGHGHLNGALFRGSSCALIEVVVAHWESWFSCNGDPEPAELAGGSNDV